MSSQTNWTTVTESNYDWEREALEFVKSRFPNRFPYQAANAKNRNQELEENVFLQLEKIESYLVELGRFNP